MNTQKKEFNIENLKIGGSQIETTKIPRDDPLYKSVIAYLDSLKSPVINPGDENYNPMRNSLEYILGREILLYRVFSEKGEWFFLERKIAGSSNLTDVISGQVGGILITDSRIIAFFDYLKVSVSPEQFAIASVFYLELAGYPVNNNTSVYNENGQWYYKNKGTRGTTGKCCGQEITKYRRS